MRKCLHALYVREWCHTVQPCRCNFLCPALCDGRKPRRLRRRGLNTGFLISGTAFAVALIALYHCLVGVGAGRPFFGRAVPFDQLPDRTCPTQDFRPQPILVADLQTKTRQSFAPAITAMRQSCKLATWRSILRSYPTPSTSDGADREKRAGTRPAIAPMIARLIHPSTATHRLATAA